VTFVERPVSVIVIEGVAAYAGYEDVLKAVVIVITDGHADVETLASQASLSVTSVKVPSPWLRNRRSEYCGPSFTSPGILAPFTTKISSKPSLL